jgi:exonuclease SbcC
MRVEKADVCRSCDLCLQAGLFAITGQTGAGKSTILDALSLAFYDKIPRLPDGHDFAVGHKDEDENLRVTSNDVRSILRRGTSHAYAEVDFIGKDKHHYSARWEVSKARSKADGRLQALEVILSNIDSGQRIGEGKKNTLEMIRTLPHSALLHAGYLQFCFRLNNPIFNHWQHPVLNTRTGKILA